MRIGIFSDVFYPELSGISDSITMVAPALAALGHEIHFFVPRYGRKEFAIANAAFGKEINLGPNVFIHRLFSIPLPTPASPQARAVIPTGLRWIWMKRYRLDVIHANVFFGTGIEALIASRVLAIPLVGTNHTMIDEFIRNMPLQKILTPVILGYDTWYYNRCQFVSGPSRSILTSMVTRGFTARHEAISNPVDVSGFAPVSLERKKKLKDVFHFGSPAIILGGRLAPEKKIDVIFRAFPAVLKKFPRATLGIAGDGSMRQPLEKLAAALRIADSVHFVGSLNHHTLAHFYNAGDVFVIASTSETQSLMLMQALACHVPAVGVDAGALPEYILPDNGMIVAAGDSEALADALITVIKRVHEWEMLHPRAFRVVQSCAPRHIAKKWESVYDDVIRHYKIIHSRA
jgi:glycosyltransferase involved in cell wall biosynthesis